MIADGVGVFCLLPLLGSGSQPVCLVFAPSHRWQGFRCIENLEEYTGLKVCDPLVRHRASVFLAASTDARLPAGAGDLAGGQLIASH